MVKITCRDGKNKWQLGGWHRGEVEAGVLGLSCAAGGHSNATCKATTIAIGLQKYRVSPRGLGAQGSSKGRGDP